MSVFDSQTPHEYVQVPVKVGRATGLPGLSTIKANADHSHELDSSFTTTLRGSRNLLDNGRFKIHQTDPAGTTFISYPGSSSGRTQADRWRVENACTCPVAVYGGLTAANPLSTSQNDINIQNQGTTALGTAGEYFRFIQNIEAQRMQNLGWGTALGKPVTFSGVFQASVSGNYTVEFEMVATNYKISRSFYLVSGVITYVTLNFPPPPIAMGVVANTPGAYGMNLSIWQSAGTTWNNGSLTSLNTSWVNAPANNTRAAGQVNAWSIASQYFIAYDLQLEIGGVASPFEDISYDDELRRCMRYYQRHTYMQLTGIIGAAAGAAISRLGAQLMVPMRATPIPTISTAPMYFYDGIAVYNFSTLATNYSGVNYIEVDTGATTSAAGVARSVKIIVFGSASIDLNAE